ncbi:MAG: ABC transporter ATP-binding protein [Ginsengibacter sp.]
MQFDFKNNLIGYYRFYYKIVGNKLLLSIFLSIIVSFLDGIGLAMFMPLLQNVADEKANQSQSMGHLHYVTDAITGMGFPLTLGTILCVLVVLFSLKGFMKFLELNYQAKIMQFFMKRVRHKLVADLQQISYRGFLEVDAGKIQNTFIAEVQRMSQAIKSFMEYTRALFMLMSYVVLALLANYQFAILVAVSAGLTNIIYRYFYKRMKNASYEISKKGNDFNSFMIQAINYFKYLKSTNYLVRYSKKLGEVINKTEALNKRIGYYTAVTSGIKEPMILIIVAGVIYVQIHFMGGNLGSIILSLILFYRALNFLMSIQQQWQNYIQNTGAMVNVSELLQTMEAHKEKLGTYEFTSIESNIIVENVELSYGSNKILNNIEIIIPKNNTIALVGESGSGKTTLANIIIGLISPDKGKILVDGTPLQSFNLKSYREKIGYISQDSVIFNDDIYNNITFWSEKTNENLNKFWEVVEVTSLKTFIENQANKEYTRLGDNGILISGGQKQRISIARELFKNAEILILDEATSALDSETEHIIQENIENLHGKYTIIVIAHRLSTIKNVNRIYLLEKGNVVVSGDFDTMLNESDKFKRMVTLQGL